MAGLTQGFLTIRSIQIFLVIATCRAALSQGLSEEIEYPEGYYPFEESPARSPPTVRKPPYAQAEIDCPGVDASNEDATRSLDNLCGDLNKGYIPKNPLGHSFDGQSYPFELVRNKTLDFFSSTLPILKEDKDLPKVAKYDDFDVVERMDSSKMVKKKSGKEKRSAVQLEDVEESSRQARALCEKNYGILCSLFKMVNNRFLSNVNPLERAENVDFFAQSSSSGNHKQNSFAEDPLTPCPSAAEYVTPVYAKNYQGVWRYVVQIPYEGYFTQTVEVTKCLRKKCHFMDGSCLASPRWLSLLVAELFYPHARFPATKPVANVKSHGEVSSREKSPPSSPELPFVPRQFSLPQGLRRSGREADTVATSTAKPSYCDGVDEIGCFQVRLYYDWFLVPGSCKCWKQDFFTKYGRKRRK